MPPHIVRYPPIQCNTRERCDQLQIPAAPPVRRAPEGPEGTAAEPVGGGGAWPGFETTRRAKLAARTARGRAAAHGHTKQPGLARHTTRATGPDGTQNISGATSNKTARPGCRRARLRCPWAAAGPGRASRRRAERSSQRGRLAGGPPPTGTPSSPATRPGPTAPGTPAAPQPTRARHAETPPRRLNCLPFLGHRN